MSPQLKQFYRDLQAWIEGGQPHSGGLVKCAGLCFNLNMWAERNNVAATQILQELQAQFIVRGLLDDYPFDASDKAYEQAAKNDEIYKNPARIAWIKEHAQ